MKINYAIKYVFFIAFIIFLQKNSLIFDNKYENYNYSKNNNENFNNYSINTYEINITNIPKIYLTINNVNYTYSSEYGLIEFRYYIVFFDQNWNRIKPTNLTLLFNLHILCQIYIVEDSENIYSIANIQDNIYFICIEYLKIKERAKLGINIYKVNEVDEEIEKDEIFFYKYEPINIINTNSEFKNDDIFNINYIYKNYNKLILLINRTKKKNELFKKHHQLKLSFLQPPLCTLKRNIAQAKGRWYFRNIYQYYFCFCQGSFCIKIKTINNYIFQSCKYFFYLTIIDKNRELYPKTDYLFSDFFDMNIESSDAFPIFQEMINRNLKAHYLTMDYNIFEQTCIKRMNCSNNLEIIYGTRKINGDFLEKYLDLILRLKAVITAEYYDCIDNLFYNIEYITFIFLGHGVTFIKSYLYEEYINPKRYNKFLLPNSKIFIDLALKAGWKKRDIIKIGYPRWDNYNKIKKNEVLPYLNSQKNKRAIFIMFTWRKVKKGKNLSTFYFDNISELLNNKQLNDELIINNIKIFFCYHHALKEKKVRINSKNIVLINQLDISKLLKNSSLIITDFSSIIFDAIVQRKPLILFIPDALDNQINNNYNRYYYETINKLKSGEIFLGEIFFSLQKVVDKIIYYIKNDFRLENDKLKFYNIFNLKSGGNTRKFINYIKHRK
jgi:hypothetical protein